MKLFRELVESKKNLWKWEGGSDAYSEGNKIQDLISQFDFYAHMTSSYPQQLKKEAKNEIIRGKLKDLGVTSFSLKSGKEKRTV